MNHTKKSAQQNTFLLPFLLLFVFCLALLLLLCQNKQRMINGGVPSQNQMTSDSSPKGEPPYLPFDKSKYDFTFQDAEKMWVKEYVDNEIDLFHIGMKGFGFTIKKTDMSLSEWWEKEQGRYYDGDKPCSKKTIVAGKDALLFSQGNNGGSSAGGVAIQDEGRLVIYGPTDPVHCDSNNIPTVPLGLLKTFEFLK